MTPPDQIAEIKAYRRGAIQIVETSSDAKFLQSIAEAALTTIKATDHGDRP